MKRKLAAMYLDKSLSVTRCQIKDIDIQFRLYVKGVYFGLVWLKRSEVKSMLKGIGRRGRCLKDNPDAIYRIVKENRVTEYKLNSTNASL